MRTRILALGGALALVAGTTGVAYAAWSDQQTLTGGTAATFTMPAVPLECRVQGNTAFIEWDPVAAPRPLAYTAALDGQAVTPDVQNGTGRYSVRVAFSPGLFGSQTRTVTAQAQLPGSSWTGPVTSRSATINRFIAARVQCDGG